MIAALTGLVFASAFGVAIAAMALSVRPQWHRIVRLAAGVPDRPFAPLARLAFAERRIAVTRWASLSSPAVYQWRAAA